MKKQLNNKKIFIYLAIVSSVIFGLYIVVMMPEITSWRLRQSDSLIEKANRVEDDGQKYSYLKQANIIGFRDPIASNELANFWIDRGEYKKAIDVYLSNIKDPNYSALGILALKARDYDLANEYFQRATKDNPTAESNAGEAVALYNLEKINEGCDKANTAIKLNLKSELANKAVESCIILGGTQSDSVRATDISALSERAIGYKLLDSLVFNQGEKRVNAIADKTAFDYLLLSKLLASQGDIDGAIAKIEEGIAIDKSISDMYIHAIELYRLKRNTTKVDEYQNRIYQLEFEKYQ